LKQIVNVIGAGLAGCEAAFQLAKRGIEVNLYEMKRIKKNDAQTSDFFAELVCSNSLRSNSVKNAAGVMKEELRMLDSLVVKAADSHCVPAGSALAVDRDTFSGFITEELSNNPLINIFDEEVVDIDFDKYTIIATGPLTSSKLMENIKEFVGEDLLYFFDAIAPIIEFDSINMDIAYFKSRYDKGTADYINCPMNKVEYDAWYQEVINAETVKLKDFELKVFEGCMPFEEMARRGPMTLTYGPMKGADWFKAIGTEKSSGTKVFALGGKIANTGLLEVPMGTTLREVIYEIGGGIPNKRRFKAAQTGGPSGGCITAESLDTPIDFDNLIALGSMMGSGGMIVMDEDNCMVDVARFYLEFTVEESCGKCTPCREGTKRMLDILNRICEGEGMMSDLDVLERLGNMIKDSSLCGLGQTAPNPVLSTLKHFRKEYEAHVIDKVCPAGVCSNLTNYVVLDNCIGCTKCARNCPVEAIEGKVKGMHHIDLDLCIRCGACKTACPVNAISTKPEGWEGI